MEDHPLNVHKLQISVSGDMCPPSPFNSKKNSADLEDVEYFKGTSGLSLVHAKPPVLTNLALLVPSPPLIHWHNQGPMKTTNYGTKMSEAALGQFNMCRPEDDAADFRVRISTVQQDRSQDRELGKEVAPSEQYGERSLEGCRISRGFRDCQKSGQKYNLLGKSAQ